MDEIKIVSSLALGLLVLMLLIGVTFVVGSKFKSTLCTTELDTNVYENGACLNATGGTAVTLDSITNTELVESAIITLLGFLGIIVIVIIAKIVIKVAKGMGDA